MTDTAPYPNLNSSNNFPASPPPRQTKTQILIILFLVVVTILLTILVWEFGLRSVVWQRQAINTTGQIDQLSDSLISTDTTDDQANTQPENTNSATDVNLKLGQAFDLTEYGINGFIQRHGLQAGFDRQLIIGEKQAWWLNPANGQLTSFSLPTSLHDITTSMYEQGPFLAHGFTIKEQNPPSDMPVFETPGKIYSSLDLQQWTLIGELPPDIPLDGGGYVLLASYNNLVAVVENGGDTSVYKTTINNNQISGWQFAGKLPFRQYTRNLAGYKLSQGYYFTVISHKNFDSYALRDEGLKLEASRALQLPNQIDLAYQPPIYTFFWGKALYMANITGIGETAKVNLWAANINNDPIDFKLVNTYALPGEKKNMREYRFASDADHLYVTAFEINPADGDSKNKMIIIPRTGN